MAKRWQETVAGGGAAGDNPDALDAIVRLAAESSGAAVAALRIAGLGGMGALYVAPGSAPLRVAPLDPLGLVDAVTAIDLGFTFFVAVPIRSEGPETLGMLAIMGDRPERPMEQILPMLRQLAGMARDLVALREAGDALSVIARHLAGIEPQGLALGGR